MSSDSVKRMLAKVFTRRLQVHPRVFKNPGFSESISFIKVGSDSPRFKVVRRAFNTQIRPIYGDQSAALAKIKKGGDRTCEMMLNYHDPLGIIIYKNILQVEYGLVNALELKTLLLLNPHKNSGYGFGSRLFERIDEVANELCADVVYCTASSKVERSIKCALKNGYQMAKILEKHEDRILYLLIKEM